MSQQTPPSPELYYVRATSIANRYYLVCEQPNSRQRWACESKAAQHGRRCWHIEAVLAGMVRAARPKAAAPAAPADAHRAALLRRVDALLSGAPAPVGPFTTVHIPTEADALYA